MGIKDYWKPILGVTIAAIIIVAVTVVLLGNEDPGNGL